MTQSQITCFMVVATTQNFSRAASMLSISQPAVSKQISLLEEELGMTLFDRTRQGVFLTDAGRLYNELFRDFTRRLRETQEEARELNRSLEDTVRIGCSEDFHQTDLYIKMADFFRSEHPNLKLTLLNVIEEELPSLLKGGQIDLVLTFHPPVFKGPDLVQQLLPLPDGRTLHMGWLTSLYNKGGRHLFVNELLFHFKKILREE